MPPSSLGSFHPILTQKPNQENSKRKFFLNSPHGVSWRYTITVERPVKQTQHRCHHILVKGTECSCLCLSENPAMIIHLKAVGNGSLSYHHVGRCSHSVRSWTAGTNMKNDAVNRNTLNEMPMFALAHKILYGSANLTCPKHLFISNWCG